MGERTPQDVSREWAEAVFANPELRERFEQMAKRTMNSEPVPDDFAFLEDRPARDEFSAFQRLARKLVRVPKAEIDDERKRA